MKLNNLIILAATALVTVHAYPALAGLSEREETKQVSLDGETQLVVRNARGRTIVVGRQNATDVSVVVKKWSRGLDNVNLEDITVEIEQDGEAVTVITNVPRIHRSGKVWRLFSRGRPGWGVDLTLEVPIGFDVASSSTSGDVRLSNVGTVLVNATSGDINIREAAAVSVELTSGDVEIGDVAGDVRVRSTSGNADLKRIGGDVEVSATSGDIEAEEVSGGFTGAVTSGDLYLNGCLGDVDFTALSGDADIENAEGSVLVNSASGDISVWIVPLKDRKFDFNTSSGDIDIVFATPNDYGFKLNLTTSSGAIDADLDIRVEKISRRQLRGVVGNGLAMMIVDTATGDVTIRESGSR